MIKYTYMNYLEKAYKEANLQTKITIDDIYNVVAKKESSVLAKMSDEDKKIIKRKKTNGHYIKRSLISYRIYRKKVRNDAIEDAIIESINEIVAERTK